MPARRAPLARDLPAELQVAATNGSIVTDSGNAAIPRVSITSASTLVLPGGVDSNSPAIWNSTEGVPELAVLTSVAGVPRLAIGPTLDRLGPAQDVVWSPHPGNGVWMEAVVVDDADTGTAITTMRILP